MRYLLPAVALAVALAAGAPAAVAGRAHRHPRARSHISLHVSRHSLLSGRAVVLRGRLRPAGARRVKIVVRGAAGHLARTVSDRRGRFALRWAPARSGVYTVRAYGAHDPRATGSASVSRRVTAYRLAAASYYGPGLYGGALACGGTLQPQTLGVASRTLPCGSRVELRFRGRTVTVPVVDRGPYVSGRDFDLTAATRARLRFPDVGVLLSSR